MYKKKNDKDLLSTLREIKYGKHEEEKKLPDLSDYVLIEKDRPIKEFCCGNCDGKLLFDLYLRISDKKSIKHITCSGCGLEFWNE